MTRESVETRSKRKQRAATKREKKRKYQARQRKVAEVCKVLTDPHTARARREGITREEAKRRSFGEQYGGGVRSGRMSASGRNLSSIPRPSMPLWTPNTLKAPKGSMFMGTDYAYGSVEGRLMAQYSKLDAELTRGLSFVRACRATKP